jgi:hypothetical protein
VNAYNGCGTRQSADLDRLITTTRSFCYHSYWARAWITQEVALSKRVDVIAGTHVTEIQAPNEHCWKVDR